MIARRIRGYFRLLGVFAAPGKNEQAWLRMIRFVVSCGAAPDARASFQLFDPVGPHRSFGLHSFVVGFPDTLGPRPPAMFDGSAALSTEDYFRVRIKTP